MIESISYWEEKKFSKTYDLIIIGAGLVGLSAALHYKYKREDSSVLILERGVVNYGASTRNAGFACFGSIGELEDDRINIPIEDILETVEMRWKGLENLREMIDDDIMDYQSLGGIELFDNEKDFQKAAIEIPFWNGVLSSIIGESVFEIVPNENPGFYHQAIFNKYEGQLDPMKAVTFLMDLCKEKGIDIKFGMEVKNWNKNQEKVKINTKQGISFNSLNIGVATNAFTTKILPKISVLPARNQVLVSEEMERLSWKGCYHYKKGYIYFRTIDNRILLGGARYISEDENTMKYGNTNIIQSFLSKFLEERIVCKTVNIDYWWSGILGVGNEKKPIITKHGDRIYCAVRLGGMGVAIGTSVGRELAELIVNE